MLAPLLFAAAFQAQPAPQLPPMVRVPSPPPIVRGCSALDAPNGLPVVALDFYEGAGMSSVAAAGEQVETTTGELRIAPGPPLVLVLSSYDSMIFRLTGDVARVRQLILVQRDGSGATGIARSRVRWVKAPPCLAGTTRLPRLYELDVARFGDGKLVPVDQHRPRFEYRGTELQREVRRFYPAGVVRIDPRNVISALPARPYQLLPSTAGAAQLEAAGAVRKLSVAESRALRIANGRRTPKGDGLIGDQYAVLRPIRLPIGLCGAHLLTFVVKRPSDVRGDACHSTVVDWSGRVFRSPFLEVQSTR